MRRDKRGRVRFAHDGHRFELTKSGLNAFERSGSGRTATEDSFYVNMRVLTRDLLSTEEGRNKLVEAINALHATEFTNAIHIPANMRAV